MIPKGIIMKKKIALFLALIMLTGCFSMGCDRHDNNSDQEVEEDEDDRPRITARRPAGSFDPEPVDVTETFDTYYADPVDTPWVLENSIPFTHGNVITYFNQFITTGGGSSEVTDAVIYNNTETLYRPNVTHYPAEQEGYTVYEINYVMDMPMSAFIPDPSNSGSTRWWYHDVNFLDYYTGMTYPYVNLTADTNSFCVTGDVVYNGETYTVSCYAYRETEVVENSTTDEDGGRVWNYESVTYMTVYFIVPDGYDGIVMYVYTADDSDKTFEECLQESEDYYNEPHIFGEPGSEEYIQDYAFISIAELG